MSSKYNIEIPALGKVVTACTTAATVRDLYRKFVKHNKLDEAAQFMGLTYIDQCGRCVWASQRSRMQDIDFSSLPPRFTLSVRKFPEEYGKLSSSTIRMLYHYVSTMVSMHPLPFEYHADFNNWLAAYKVRACNVDTSRPGFSIKASLLPPTTKEQAKVNEEMIKKYLTDVKDVTEQQAMVKYLKSAYANGCYYQALFTVKNFNRTSVILLGVGPTGLMEYTKSSGSFTLNEVIHWGQLYEVNPISFACASLEVNYLNGDDVGNKKYLCYRKDGEAILELANDYAPDFKLVVRDGRPNVTDAFVWPFWEFHGKQHAPDCNCYLSDEEIFWRETNYRPTSVADVEVISGAYSLSSIERHRKHLDSVYQRLFTMHHADDEPSLEQLIVSDDVVEVFQVKKESVIECMAAKSLKSESKAAEIEHNKQGNLDEKPIDIILPQCKDAPKDVAIKDCQEKPAPKIVNSNEVMRKMEEAVRPDLGSAAIAEPQSKSKIHWRPTFNKVFHHHKQSNNGDTLPEKEPRKMWRGVKKTFNDMKVMCPNSKWKSKIVKLKRSKRKTPAEEFSTTY